MTKRGKEEEHKGKRGGKRVQIVEQEGKRGEK